MIDFKGAALLHTCWFGWFQTGSVSFHSGSNSTYHKPLCHDKAGLIVGISEAVLAGDLSRVAQVDLNALMHHQLHLGPGCKTHRHTRTSTPCFLHVQSCGPLLFMSHSDTEDAIKRSIRTWFHFDHVPPYLHLILNLTFDLNLIRNRVVFGRWLTFLPRPAWSHVCHVRRTKKKRPLVHMA